MFAENMHSLAMIAHSMCVIKAAVQHVNPLQTPVIELDQSLFAFAKQIQWIFPEFCEVHFVIMLGKLHIGKWLSSSGWEEVMCNAGLATRGSRVISVGKPCNPYTMCTPSDSCKSND